MDILKMFFSDYTIRTVSLGAGLLSLISGVLGSFAVLRKQSLIGDAISHASLPGIALVFLIFRTKDSIFLALGAIAISWIAALLINAIVDNTKIKYDSALGIILSVFFGFGMVLLTLVQKLPDANQAGLDKYLFGQAASLLAKDIINMSILGSISLIILLIFWKEFKLLSFDSEYAKSLGYNIKFLDTLLTTLIIVAIVVGLQTVGVVLMSAMLIAPAAASRQWTEKISIMVILAGILGFISGVSGAILSSTVSKLPTGPTIILIMTFITIFSFLFGSKRGLVWKWLRFKVKKTNYRKEFLIDSMYEIIKNHDNKSHEHSIDILKPILQNNNELKVYLKELQNQNIINIKNYNWSFTQKGIQAMKRKEVKE